MDLSSLKSMAIPEGEVVQISVGNTILWKAGYTNQMPISIGTDGNVYNGVGWKGRVRLSASAGNEKEQANAGVTGFIPVKSGDIGRFKDLGENLLWGVVGASGTYCSLVYYGADFSYLGAVTMSGVDYGICVSADAATGNTEAGGIVSFAVPANTNIAYVRISISTKHSDGSDLQDIVVTVNEEIV